jgi:small subunit ribosomal protein S7
VEGARSRSNKEFPTFDKKLTAEILEASKNQGFAISKKQQTEKTAEQNKAFSHLKW